MLDISGWITHLRSVCISRSSSKIYKRYQTNIASYYLKKISTVYDAVKFLKLVANEGYSSADALMERLCYLYSQYLPTELDLARLSLLHQSVSGTQGIEEYSTLTIWTCAIQSIMEDENKKQHKVKLDIVVVSPTSVSVLISILN